MYIHKRMPTTHCLDCGGETYRGKPFCCKHSPEAQARRKQAQKEAIRRYRQSDKGRQKRHEMYVGALPNREVAVA